MQEKAIFFCKNFILILYSNRIGSMKLQRRHLFQQTIYNGRYI